MHLSHPSPGHRRQILTVLLISSFEWHEGQFRLSIGPSLPRAFTRRLSVLGGVTHPSGGWDVVLLRSPCLLTLSSPGGVLELLLALRGVLITCLEGVSPSGCGFGGVDAFGTVSADINDAVLD